MRGKLLFQNYLRRVKDSGPMQLWKYGLEGRHDHKGFPRWVHIENTNHCPARCSMCSMDQMERTAGTMDFELLKKIIDECAHYRQVEQIHLHGFGEPLLDKNLPAKVLYAKEKTKAHTYIVTTMNLMTEDYARELISAGIDGIKVSLYANTKESYEAIHRRLKFEKTLEAMDIFLRVRDELKSSTPAIKMQYAEGMAPSEEFEGWKERWRPKLDADRGDSLLVSTLHNWGGKKLLEGGRLPEKDRQCVWPFKDIQILWDGRVSPCVFDYDGTLILGNVRETTIREIWLSKPYEAFRAPWRQGKSFSIPMCKACDVPDEKFVLKLLPPEMQPRSLGIIRDSGDNQTVKKKDDTLF
jgi:radical SAM protein with 4Fe4S-binding SPASM domain